VSYAQATMRSMRSTSFLTRLLALGAAGLAIRLGYALGVMGGRDVRGDGREFHFLTNVLGSEGRYLQPFRFLFEHGTAIPTAEKPPLYPAVLAPFSAIGLDTVQAQRVISCVMGAAAVVLIGLLARRVAGDRVGLVAAGLAAIYPPLVMLDASLRSESLYAPLIALALLLAYRLRDRPGVLRAAALGVAIGLAALTRSEALLLVVLLGVPLALLLPPGTRLRPAIAVVAGCALVVTPWLARNWIVFDRPAAISTNEGGLLAGANCDAAYYSQLIGTWACFPRDDPAWGTNEALISSKQRKRAIDYAGDHAGRLPAVVGVRVLRVWDLWDPRDAAEFEAGIADRHIRAQQASMVALYLMAPLAIVGAVVLRRRDAPLWLLAAPVVLVTLVGATSYGSTRFRVAAEIPIVVLGSVALVAGWDRLRQRGAAGSATTKVTLRS
jgi:4-amino-4-deoxy-L-arabinose transferase-like glycosyltransferase